MSAHSLTLLLTFTLFGVNYCQKPCSFDNLIKNLSFPNPNVRPVKNWTTVTEVSIGMSLYSVVQLETNTQTLSTLVWFSMTWKDEFIGWDPKQFCSLEKLFTSKGTFWKPDLYVYESSLENIYLASAISLPLEMNKLSKVRFGSICRIFRSSPNMLTERIDVCTRSPTNSMTKPKGIQKKLPKQIKLGADNMKVASIDPP
ncbi:acetylcholine receptor subunit alpha-type acr-5-like [Ranitomeya imitator]|uniref:acetylcholine receptor subunit alpha-type acr-5-like n=1 Tax=Ranitomeya imitator TaxID=111125 RepID=UPI0037E9767E